MLKRENGGNKNFFLKNNSKSIRENFNSFSTTTAHTNNSMNSVNPFIKKNNSNNNNLNTNSNINHFNQNNHDNSNKFNKRKNNRLNDKIKQNKQNKNSNSNSPNNKKIFNGKDVNQIGPILQNPESMGFQKVNHKPRELPRFLITPQPQLTTKHFKQDYWDRLNQQKMLRLEESIDDMQELYETLKKMRDTERTIMENKGLVDKAELSKDLNDAIIFQGTCQDMCPIFERARRNVEYTVFSYERDLDKDDKKASRWKALKVFARPAAAAAPPLPSDVRPPHILMKTLDYIVDNLLDTLPKSESFLWDRMRSIRQDFTYQNYCGPEAVDCNERIVRIHLLILHIMVKTNSTFSLQQELEQLHKSLITLSEIYDDMRSNGLNCPNEAEFRAYSLLSKIRDPQYDETIQKLPSDIFNNNLVQLAICFRKIISNSNYSERGYIRTENSLNFYYSFFKLLGSSKVPFLMGSFLQIYLNEIRFYCLKALSHSLNKKHKPIPYEYLQKILLFNNIDELRALCEYYSITFEDDAIDLRTLQHHSHKIPESKALSLTYLKIVDDKIMGRSYAQIINSALPNVIAKPEADLIIDMVDDEIENNHQIIDNNISPMDLNTNIANDKNVSALNFNAKNASSLTNLMHELPKLNKNDALKLNVNDVKNDIYLQKTELNIQTDLISKRQPEKELPNFNISSTGIDDTFIAKTDNFIKVKEESHPKVHFNDTTSNNIFNGNDSIIVQKQKIKQEKELEQKKLFEEEQKQKQLNEQKEQEKIQQKEAIANITDNMIKDITGNIIKDVIIENKKEVARKANIIDSISNELFDAFLHERLYLIYLETKAITFHKTKKVKDVIKNWKNKFNKKKIQKEKEKKHREELELVRKQLGVPSLKRARHILDTPNTKNSDSFLISSDRKRRIIFSPINTEVNNFSTKLLEKNELWLPFDLTHLYFNKIINKVPKDRMVDLDIFLYASNWSSVSNSWVLNKFGLKSQKDVVSLNDEMVNLNVKCINDKFDATKLNHTQLIVFNTGVTEPEIFDLELKLQKDGEELIKLITNASLQSETCFNILIIYWDSSETKINSGSIARYLKLNRIEKSFNDIVLNIGFVKITDSSPHKSLEYGLNKMANDFKFTLTEKGQYLFKMLRKPSYIEHSLSSKELKTTQKIDEKMRRVLEMENDIYKKQLNKRNTYAHLQSHIMTSPKLYKKKLPVLLSASKHSNKFKTPLPSRYVSGTTPSGTKSYLVNKIQSRASMPDSYSTNMLPPPSTPSHSTNLPVVATSIAHRTPIVNNTFKVSRSHSNDNSASNTNTNSNNNKTYNNDDNNDDNTGNGNNTSMNHNMFGFSNRQQILFQTPIHAIIKSQDNHSVSQAEDSEEVQELKGLIETVRKIVKY